MGKPQPEASTGDDLDCAQADASFWENEPETVNLWADASPCAWAQRQPLTRLAERAGAIRRQGAVYWPDAALALRWMNDGRGGGCSTGRKRKSDATESAHATESAAANSAADGGGDDAQDDGQDESDQRSNQGSNQGSDQRSESGQRESRKGREWEREQALLAHIGTNPEWIDPQCEVHRKKAIKVMQARHGQSEG